LVPGELVHQIAKDELQRVVVLRAGAEERERVFECAATPATELPGHPAQEQRVADGLLVESDTLGFAALGKLLTALREIGNHRERCVAAELFEFKTVTNVSKVLAAGEDGLAAQRQALDERKEFVAVGFRERFEVVEDE